ncbi:hypothetical protein C1646_777259 [Rhizophagus diaphanus]|nr:hypothetical protein C1646_777259 [Rhizophagus diaphanus] [Rhizophagus sp. MUCL 43196]
MDAYNFELLKGQFEFPPQISISVLKTSETNKNLIKYCYCEGYDKKNQILFRIIINNIDLIQSKEFVKINEIYLINKRQCRHLDEKIFVIGDINDKEKDDYIKVNGVDLVNKCQLWDFI